MSNLMNYPVSVACVVFGFDGENLNVMLKSDPSIPAGTLPRTGISTDIDLDIAANDTICAATGCDKVAARQLRTVVVNGECIVIYSLLLRVNVKIRETVRRNGYSWTGVKQLDGNDAKIIDIALNDLVNRLSDSAAVFDLLPHKFTIHNVQRLYESALRRELDNRNFRKKIIGSGYIVSTEEKQRDVAHKPAVYYVFDRARFMRNDKHKSCLDFTRCGK